MPLPPPLFALWFSNPLVLWGLGAAALPILIHLLNRRKYREMPWAAMRFLLAAIKKNQRRVRIEQWLLLAVRTLLVILVVSAMAKPFLESLGAVALLPGQRTHWVLAIDGSLSMQTTEGDGTRFDRARSLATQLVKSARPGDGVSLVLLADPPRAIIGAPSFQRDATVQEISQLTGAHGSLDVPAGFRKVEEVLDASDIARKELVVLTDLQATTWNARGNAGDPNFKRLLDRLAARKVRSTVIDLGGSAGDNHAVTDLQLDPPIVTPNLPAIVRASVRQFGRGAGGEVRARLVVDGRLGPEETVRLQPGQDQAIAFPYRFPAAGEHTVEVMVDPDQLKLDDRRRLVVPIRDSVRVLLVDGDPRPEELKSETAFLAAALGPDEEAAGGANGVAQAPVSPLALETINEAQLAGRDLAPYDAVVLANIARFTRAEAAALEAYLAQGGGLVVFGGDRVAADNYNQLLYADGKGLLPAAIGPAVGDPARRERPFEFDPLGYKHPIVSLFAGEAPGVQASLTGVKTARYFRLQVPKGSPAQVAIAFSSGDPAVVEKPYARGRVLLVATSADAEWSSWPLHQSFPPVMEQLVLAAASGRAAERTVAVGQPLVQAFPAAAAGAGVAVKRPAGEPSTTRLEPAGPVSLLRFDATDLSGLYQAQVGPPVDQTLGFAANPTPAESDPTKLDASALKAAVPGWDFHYDDAWKPLSRDAASIGHRGELHRPFLWGVLGLLLLESFMAWRFGHHPIRR